MGHKYRHLNLVVLTDADMEKIGRLRDEDVARLYQRLTDRLRATKRLDAPNANVVTCRVEPGSADRVRALALKFRTTRSRLLRQALNEFLKRNPL